MCCRYFIVRSHSLLLSHTASLLMVGWLELSLTPRSTQYRSFRRRANATCMRDMLEICDEFAIDFDLKFNSSKSVAMRFGKRYSV